MGASSCFADFSSHEQAKRAMEAMDAMPLLGREVEIELVKETPSAPERKKYPHPIMTVGTPKDKSFQR